MVVNFYILVPSLEVEKKKKKRKTPIVQSDNKID